MNSLMVGKLSILRNNFRRDTRTFAPDSEILEALQQISVGQSNNFKQIQNPCMRFFKFKKHEAIAHGAQALDLRLPFDEIEVLKENLDLIKRLVQKMWKFYLQQMLIPWPELFYLIKILLHLEIQLSSF